VAIVNAVPCTLPLEAAPPGQAPLDFPAGLASLAEFTGEPLDRQALGQIAFLVQPRVSGARLPPEECAWLGSPASSAELVESFRQALVGYGAEVQVGDEQPPLVVQQRALSFFEGLPVQP
jgi:hypothetical protein